MQQVLTYFHSFDCQTYTSLTEADRKASYTTSYSALTKCDGGRVGWFRFQGSAGTKMATRCPRNCNTDSPGWLSGGHSKVTDGIVTRKVDLLSLGTLLSVVHGYQSNKLRWILCVLPWWYTRWVLPLLYWVKSLKMTFLTQFRGILVRKQREKVAI